MTMGRTLGLLSLFAGLTAWFVTRAAMREQARLQLAQEDVTRWETDGGATTDGPQAPDTSR